MRDDSRTCLMASLRITACAAACALTVLAGASGRGVAQEEAASVDPLAPVVAELDEALDRGDAAGVMALLSDVASRSPAQAPELAATAALLAPWMAAEAAEVVLQAVPASDRDPQAARVLAAVLTASEGRQGDALLAAVRRAAPGADAQLLTALVDRLAVGGDQTSVPGDAEGALYDLDEAAASPSMTDALRRGRASTRDGRRSIGSVSRRDREMPEPEAGVPVDVSPGHGGDVDDHTEPRFVPVPRLPSPAARPSPS